MTLDLDIATDVELLDAAAALIEGRHAGNPIAEAMTRCADLAKADPDDPRVQLGVRLARQALRHAQTSAAALAAQPEKGPEQ